MDKNCLALFLFFKIMMNIRIEKDSDKELIWKLNSHAFPTNVEADLVDILRNSGVTLISMVAEEEGEIIGHILFSDVELIGNKSKIKLAGLGPMAVIPKLQRKGIGSKLVNAGLEHCRKKGYDAVVVLGYPEYYPKFGFVPSVEYSIKCEFEVPSEAFMILELKKGAFNGLSGTIRYHESFNNL